MNVEALFLFLILLLSLVLCSFLGGNCNKEPFSMNENKFLEQTGVKSSKQSTNTNNTSSTYDNYNHYNGSSTELENGTTFTGNNGGNVVVTTNSDGTQSLKVTLQNGVDPVIFNSSSNSSTSSIEGYTTYTGINGIATTFYGPNGSSATVIKSNGKKVVQIKTSTGTYTFTESGTYHNPNTYTSYFGSTGTPINTSSYAYNNNEIYYGPNGGTIRINVNGKNTFTMTNPDGTTIIFTGKPDKNGTVTKYTGPEGGTATVITLSTGEKGIKVTDENGTSVTFSIVPNHGYYGGSAGYVTGPQGNTAYYAEGPYGNTVAGTTNQNTGYYGGSAGSVTGPQGNTAYYAQGPNGNTVAGITANQIPAGDEDLYILKSQVVPPVCPACPSSASCPRQEKCPPCPACARCPEPSFECKKVPNYNAIDNNALPIPVLNDFSSFGM